MSDRKRCPTCRQFLPHAPVDGLKLSPQQRKIYTLVRRAGDNGILTELLIDDLYSATSVPLNARKIVHIAVWSINKQLRPKGFRIRGHNRGRYVDGEYFFGKEAAQ